MVPRAFPSSFRVGIDLCKIDRIKGIIQPKTLKKNHASQFFKRLLTPRELRYFKLRFVGPQMHGEGQHQQIANYLAGRWAAKEACVKAVKPRKLTHSEIEIWPDEKSETYAIILDAPGSAHADKEGDNYVDLVTKDKTKAEYQTEVDRDFESRFREDRNPNPNPLELVPSHEHVEGQVVRVSLSHDTDYACAVAIYAGDDASPENNLTNVERELEKLRQRRGMRRSDSKP